MMETNENQNILYIEMLGGFHMLWRGEPVILGKNLSSKMLHLLLILVYSRGEGIRREKILEQLYPDTDIEQASNSLRAILYRLRKSLVAAGLPEQEFISTKGGIYRWQSQNIEIRLDVEEFQKCAAAALEEQDMERKARLLEDACRAYTGEFLPMMTGDDWVAAANWKYQELYFKCLRQLTSILKDQGRYQELLACCDRALSKYPYEEWQLLKLDCLTAMKEYKKALEYYEQVTSNYQREFGMMPSEEMIRRYRTIKNGIQFEMNNIEEIQSHLQPESDISYGATQCDYLTFIDIYRYMVWVLERNGIVAYLALFTIVDKDGVPLEISELLEETRLTLEKAICSSVRKSDLYSRYGKNQFLVLMVGADDIGCRSASERIRTKFHSLNRRKWVDIYYSSCPARDMPEEEIRRYENKKYF